MAEPDKPVLQKPPGYRDPGLPVQMPPRPPPRKPVLPPSFPYRKKKRRSCCRICCCFLCTLISALILLLLVAGGLFYVFFDPHLPVFHLRSVRIPRFNVTAKPDDGTYLDARAAVAVEAWNPNPKISLYYGRSVLELSDSDGSTALGSGSLPEFTQPRMNSTVLKFAAAEGRTALVDGEVGTRLKARFRSKTLRVHVEVRTRLGLGVERWRIGTVGVHVLCGDIPLKRLAGGAMPKCTINLLKWINIH